MPCDLCPNRPFAPGDAPCQGPSCSGNKLPQGVVPTTTIEVRDPPTMLFNWLAEATNGSQQAWLETNSLVRPIERTDSVFHPPRHA